jgi:hypothetical protein
MQRRDYNMRTRRRRGANNAPFPFFTRTAAFNLLAGLILGIALALVYAWQISPATYTDTTPATLRTDHKTDYVLMIAQSYAHDGDLPAARTRLESLNVGDPGAYITALITAQIQLGASTNDLSALSALAVALGANPPPLP